MEFWVCIVILLMISYGLIARNESLKGGAIGDAQKRIQETASRTARQRKQDLPRIHADSLQRDVERDAAPGTNPQGEPTPATRKCNADNNDDRKAWRDPECLQQTGSVTPDCTPNFGYNYIEGAVARHVYIHMCPKLKCWFVTEPCPRNWQSRLKGPFKITCDAQSGLGILYHYTINDLKIDTLYDVQSNVIEPNKQEFTLPLMRTHTCKIADLVPNLHMEAYGLGWIYFVWRRPLENCYALIDYTEQYNYNDSKNNFSQAAVGSFLQRDGYYTYTKFHPCPRYPSWFCFIISENVVPFKTLTFKVQTQRFQGEDGDTSGWTTIDFTTDDKGLTFIFCPKVNIFLTLWFLILLIVLLLLLLIVAAILLGLIYKAKKELEKLDDDEGYEEETIPPSNVFEKIWERLRNFFDELCPTPRKPPPPPPPPPPPKPKPPKKKPPPKPKPKPMPKPKKKPKPMPPPPQKEVSPSPPPPPPPPVPTPRKERRGARADTKGRDAAMMDTKRMASGVGGVRARRRR